MGSFIFDSCLHDQANGRLNFGADSFKCLLLSAVAVPSKSGWRKRSDVVGEVTGTGYTAGGVVVSVSAAMNGSSEDVKLGGFRLSRATVSARYGVYYKSRGGDASEDELVACIDFGETSSTNATWLATDST